MDKELAIGDEVLIINSIFSHGSSQFEPIKEFITGRVIEKYLSDDLSYHGSPWNVNVYKVLGEDDKVYTGTYGTHLVGDSFFYTREDYIDYLNRKIDCLNKEENELRDYISCVETYGLGKAKRYTNNKKTREI